MKKLFTRKFYKKHSFIVTLLLVTVVYTLISVLLYSHKLQNITTHYGMPDVDGDGGLWYRWYLIFTENENRIYYINHFFSYPFGYDITFLPFRNLTYSIQVFIVQNIIGYNWNNLILLTNVSTVITYPLSAIGGFLLCYYLTKNKIASFFAGLIFSFSFYHVHMGRVPLSLNHIELIPFYFLSLFYFLDKRNLFSLLISSTVFALLFNSDAYYAFFSGLLSPCIIAFYQRESFIKKIKAAIIYYSVLFVVLIAVNFNFFVTNFYLFNSQDAIATGRNSIPRNELLSIFYYFLPPNISMLYTYIPSISYISYLLIPLLALSGFFFVSNRRLYITLAVCFLVGLIMSTYTPYLYWINELYFKYFGMFRSVSRMVLLSYLFVGLMVGVTISEFIKSKYYKKTKKKIIIVGYLVLIIVVVVNVVTVDPTWWRLSDFSKEVALYEPIKKNNAIKAIATYPMTQGGQVSGCPEPYLLKAQIIHNKAFACGASPFDPVAKHHYKAMSDISDPETVNYLTKYNIDTIMIYNKLLKNANEINKKLLNDQRLIYIADLRGTPDEGYTSTTDKARDISVYQIKKVVEYNKLEQQPLIYSTDKNIILKYTKKTPERYFLTVNNISKEADIIFTLPYSKKWQMYIGDVTNNDILLGLNYSDINKEHERFNQSSNKWRIDIESLKKQIPNAITFDKFGKAHLNATIFFAPQSMFLFGSYFSAIVFHLLVIYFIIHIFYERFKR